MDGDDDPRPATTTKIPCPARSCRRLLGSGTNECIRNAHPEQSLLRGTEVRVPTNLESGSLASRLDTGGERASVTGWSSRGTSEGEGWVCRRLLRWTGWLWVGSCEWTSWRSAAASVQSVRQSYGYGHLLVAS